MKSFLGDGIIACDKEKCDHASGNFYGPDLACEPMPVNAECNPEDTCITYICSDGYELNPTSTTIRLVFKFVKIHLKRVTLRHNNLILKIVIATCVLT